MFWVVGTVMQVLLHGESLPRAAAFAGVGAVSGPIWWACYHATSRRNDGLLIMGMGYISQSAHSHRATPVGQELAVGVFVLFILALFSAVCGWFLRGPRKDEDPPADSPLWDAEVDHSGASR